MRARFLSLARQHCHMCVQAHKRVSDEGVDTTKTEHGNENENEGDSLVFFLLHFARVRFVVFSSFFFTHILFHSRNLLVSY